MQTELLTILGVFFSIFFGLIGLFYKVFLVPLKNDIQTVKTDINKIINHISTDVEILKGKVNKHENDFAEIKTTLEFIKEVLKSKR